MKILLIRSLVGFALAAVTTSALQAADAYPAKPVRIVVSSAPGGSVDIITRMVAQKMSENLGQPVIVENRAGADTLIGIRYVKAAAPDGYTVLATSSSITTLPFFKLDTGYDLLQDFSPIGMMTRSPWVIVVGVGQPDKTLAELVARGKERPEAISFATSGLGTAPYMGAALFLQRAGVKGLHVPYKGNGAALPDVIGGRVTMIFQGVSVAAELIKAGQLRALGVTSETRLSALPDVPTVAEQGMPGFSNYFFTGLLAPAGTPPDAVQRLSRSMLAATKELHARFESEGVETPTATPAEFLQSLKQDLDSTAKLTAALDVKKE